MLHYQLQKEGKNLKGLEMQKGKNKKKSRGGNDEKRLI